jgi:hypothetical protein
MPPGDSDLTDAAKAEIAEAVKIVREDKLHSMVRELHSRTPGNPPDSKPGDPPAPPSPGPKPGDPPAPPANDPPNPPPPSDPPPDPPKKNGLFWGDRLD